VIATAEATRLTARDMQRSRAERATAKPRGGGEFLSDAGKEMKKCGIL